MTLEFGLRKTRMNCGNGASLNARRTKITAGVRVLETHVLTGFRAHVASDCSFSKAIKFSSRLVWGHNIMFGSNWTG